MSQSYGMLRWGSGPGADFFQREGVVFRANSQKRIAPGVLSESHVERTRVKPDRAIKVSHFEVHVAKAHAGRTFVGAAPAGFNVRSVFVEQPLGIERLRRNPRG